MMKTFIVVVTLVVAITARPDVSHIPTGSYLPAGGHGHGGSGHFGSSGFGIGGLSGSGGFHSQSHGGFGSGGSSGFHGGFSGLGSSFHGGLGGSGGGFHGGSGGSFHGGSGGSFHGGSGGGFHGGSGGGFHGGFGGSGGGVHGGLGGVGGGFHGGSFGGIGGGGGFAQDQKHVYFYAAPEEYSSSRLRINIVPNSQRNTKIIFVKAPTYGAVIPEVNAPQSLSEDKTLVYVLVKRPEHGGEITIPTGVGVKPSKPEVFFIKYKTQHDAQHQISGGLQGQQVGSHVPDLGSASNFVSTLDSGSSSGSHGVENFGTVGGPNGIDVRSGFTSGSASSGSSFGPAGASGPY